MAVSTKLEKKLLKNPSSRFSVLIAKVLRKKRTCKNLPIKKIYFTLQFNSIKYIKFIKFILYPNFIEGFQALSPSIWSIILIGL